MPGEALKSQTPNRSDNFARKARVLLELFGPGGLERLEGAGLEPGIVRAIEQAADTAEEPGGEGYSGRDGLLHRFRERGLLEQASGPALREAPQASSAMAAEGISTALGQRIAAHLSDENLDKENPAVIAYILKSQPKSVQGRVLRALPGACARATIRHMRR